MEKLILLVAVLGLLMVGEARAEGAWILWQKAQITKTTWIIEGAFPSCTACIQNEVSVCKESASVLEHKCEAIEGQHFISFSNSRSITWMCLPESVDPRK